MKTGARTNQQNDFYLNATIQKIRKCSDGLTLDRIKRVINCANIWPEQEDRNLLNDEIRMKIDTWKMYRNGM